MAKNFDVIYTKKGAYHFNLNDYDKYWHHENYEIIKSFIGDIDNKSILDIGCGDGYLTSQLGNNTIGLDISKEGLKLARKLTKNNYVLADMKDLPFKNKSFDVIINSLSMMYVKAEDLAMVIKEFKRVLKLNGKAVISFPNIEDLRRRLYVIFGRVSDYRREDADKAPGEVTLDKLEELFLGNGFRLKSKKGIFVTLPYFGGRLGKYKFFYVFMTKLAKVFPNLSDTVVYEFIFN